MAPSKIVILSRFVAVRLANPKKYHYFSEPRFALTELALKRHAPLWLYIRLLCDVGPPGERRVRGR